MKQYKFTGELFQGPRGGYYIDFPFDVQAEFGTGKQVKVKIWFDGCCVRKSLLPKGDGRHWLSVSIDIRKAIAKTDGDKVEVVLEADLEPRTVTLPEDFEWLLDDEPDMKRLFLGQSFNTQKFFSDWIDQSHEPDTRVNRINSVFDWLRQRKTGRKVSFKNEGENGE